MFCRYALRSTDAIAGRKFYADAMGLELPEGSAAGTILEAWPLHERARAMGVPSHWLGHVAVDDAEACATRLVALGSKRLGPSVQVDERVSYATLRDPFGAVIAVRQGTVPTTQTPVGWHQLHTRDAEGAMAFYNEHFGCVHTHTVDAPDPEGGHRLFASEPGSAPVGAIANTARWPGVHVHWLFYFPIDDVDAAVVRVRALGGNAFDPVVLPDIGRRFAACEDPQGAAFGLVGPAQTFHAFNPSRHRASPASSRTRRRRRALAVSAANPSTNPQPSEAAPLRQAASLETDEMWTTAHGYLDLVAVALAGNGRVKARRVSRDRAVTAVVFRKLT